MRKITLGCMASLALFFIMISPALAQESTSRLHLPVTNQVQIIVESDESKVIVKDYLNSTRMVNNNTADSTHYPFGDEASGSIIDDETDKRFTGHRKLDDVAVYHAGARFYSPRLGTFVQADSVEGPNRYAYVRNNPIIFADPSGNSPITDPVRYTQASFPNALPVNENVPLIWQRNGATTYAEYLYNDPILDEYAYTFINRNPYDPKTEREDFVRHLSKDIYETIDFSEHSRRAGKRIGNADRRIQKLLEQDGYPASQGVNLKELQEARKYYDYAIRKSSEVVEMHHKLTLGERIQQNYCVCEDIANVTAYTMAQAGIPNAVGGIYGDNLAHSVNLAYIDDSNIPYVIDATWYGYVGTFYEDRAGLNEFSRPYDDWIFKSPWSQEFGFNLNP